jgi:23S rRNA (cytosine1962-C5)-methyltransferase
MMPTVRLAHVPPPAARRIALRVTPAAERMLRAGHPWLFDRAIREQSHEGRPGDLAVVFDRRQRFLAVGLYDPLSPIRVRVLQHLLPAPIGRAWFRQRLREAAALRAPLLDHDTDGYRLVHGGNDRMPGLVIDRYARTQVLKLYTTAWVPHLADVLAALDELLPAERRVVRLGRAVQEQPEWLYGLQDGTILQGPELAGPVIFRENGLRFEVEPIRGQKTGFFLDQRENRARVAGLSAGKAVLDLFAYTGGFSLYAARGGARTVLSVDASQPALAAAERNFALNCDLPGVADATHQTLVADGFEALQSMDRQSRRVDLAIVDPPAFAHSRAEVAAALRAYHRLAQLALGVLRSGGTLVFSSCSRHVPADDFFHTVHRAAAEVGRPLRERERTGHPLDHPATFHHAAYLKCLYAVAP